MQKNKDNPTLFDSVLPKEAEEMRTLMGEQLRCPATMPDPAPVQASKLKKRLTLSHYLVNAQSQRIAGMEERLTAAQDTLAYLSSFHARLLETNSVIRLLHMVVHDFGVWLGADSAFVTIMDGDVIAMIENRNIDIEEALALQQGDMFTDVKRERIPLLFKNVRGSTAIIAPIPSRDGNKGFCAFFRDFTTPDFTEADLQKTTLMVSSFAPLLESIFLHDFISQTYLNTVKALASAIDAKDQYTHGHSYRVAKYSVLIAKQLGICSESLMLLELSGYMHDIGKIGIAEAVLTKPGRLTDDEFVLIKQHPVLALRILEPASLPCVVLRAAAEHHERLDGSGYPYGLRGDEISVEGRIVAVADVFDALTSDRTYRSRMTLEEAFNILMEKVDVWYDANVLAALLTYFSTLDGMDEFCSLNDALSCERGADTTLYARKLLKQLEIA